MKLFRRNRNPDPIRVTLNVHVILDDWAEASIAERVAGAIERRGEQRGEVFEIQIDHAVLIEDTYGEPEPFEPVVTYK